MYLEKLGHHTKKCHQITLVFKGCAQGTLISTHQLIHQLGGFQLPVSLSFSASISASELLSLLAHFTTLFFLLISFIISYAGHPRRPWTTSGCGACQRLAGWLPGDCSKEDFKGSSAGEIPQCWVNLHTVLPSHLRVQPHCLSRQWGRVSVFLFQLHTL